MIEFELHTVESAPAGSKEALAAVQETQGMIPNNMRALANSPSALKAYLGVVGPLFENGALSPAEQCVVQMAVSREHGCQFCVPFYTFFSSHVGLDDSVVSAIRDGDAIPDAKLAALAEFAVALVRERGKVAEEQVDAFFAAGFTKEQVLDVLGGIAAKTYINYLNQLAELPLNDFMEEFAWATPTA